MIASIPIIFWQWASQIENKHKKFFQYLKTLIMTHVKLLCRNVSMTPLSRTSRKLFCLKKGNRPAPGIANEIHILEIMMIPKSEILFLSIFQSTFVRKSRNFEATADFSKGKKYIFKLEFFLEMQMLIKMIHIKAQISKIKSFNKSLSLNHTKKLNKLKM